MNADLSVRLTESLIQIKHRCSALGNLAARCSIVP